MNYVRDNMQNIFVKNCVICLQFWILNGIIYIISGLVREILCVERFDEYNEIYIDAEINYYIEVI